MGILAVVNIVFSLALVIGGLGMKSRALSADDRSLGYKSARSLASQDAWTYANQTCGKLWASIGAGALLLTILLLLTVNTGGLGAAVQAVLLVLQAAGMIISLAAVESQLKKRFDK